MARKYTIRYIEKSNDDPIPNLPNPRTDIPPDDLHLVRISGQLENFTTTKVKVDFLEIKNTGQELMGWLFLIFFILSFFSREGSTSTNHAPYSSNQGLTEEGEYLRFHINGKPAQGWVWKNPFGEGSKVDVAVAWQGDHYEVYGIARPKERIITLYPHCSCSVSSYIKNEKRNWKYFSLTMMAMVLFLGLIFFVFAAIFERDISIWMGFKFFVGLPFVAGIFISFISGLTYFKDKRENLPFAKLSEKIFNLFEFENPEDIDLVKISKKFVSKDRDFGKLYFHY